MAKNKHVSVLMEKIMINLEMYLFKPIDIIKGDYDEYGEFFVDEKDETYFSIDDIYSVIDSPNTLYFSTYYTTSDLKRCFPASTKKESIKLLWKSIQSSLWLGFIKDDEIDIARFSIEELKFNGEDLSVSGFENEQICALITEEYLDKLLNEEDLTQTQKALINIKETLKDQNYMIDKEKEVKKEQTDYPTPITSSPDTVLFHKKVDIPEMFKYIRERVVGQDDAIKHVITTFVMNKIRTNDIVEEELTKILLTGPTGSGKTLILDTMLEYLDVAHNIHFPVAKVATSQLTAAGYVGNDLEDILETLIKNTKGDFSTDAERITYAEENGIVYLDEIDKKGTSNNSNISGRAVLNSLLQFISGSDYGVIRKHHVATGKFNTKNLTFFFSGAFTNVFDNPHANAIGFNSTNKPRSRVNVEDFIKYGNMPSELMGRIHKIINLNPLSKEDLSTILLNSKKSTLLAMKEKLNLLGTNLVWDDTFTNRIVEEAYKKKIGARPLKGIIEVALQEIYWDALNCEDNCDILVTGKTVEDPNNFKLIQKNKAIG